MQVLEKVAKAISRNYGITVKFMGTDAYTDGKQIVLPSLPENLDEKAAIKCRGYCDHETGHVLFIDTRKPSEMKVSMLPGALSKEAFLKDPLKYRDLTIIAYCTISYRSGDFAVRMSNKGIDIYNLEGGLLAWVLEGGKVYDAGRETKRVHVYGKKWNYLPKEYEPVFFSFFEKYF